MTNNGIVLQKLFYYSVALFVLPLTMYYVCDLYIAELLLGHNSRYHVALCGGAAAMSVNFVLGMYVYMALQEDSGFGRGELKRQGKDN